MSAEDIPRRHSDVLVVGGGIIGVCCARELAERGLSVTIIDQRDIGHGCSYGNAGWLTPCFALPLPMPGMLLKSLGWLTDPDSPLYIQPRLSWMLVAWLWRFMRSMKTDLMQQSVRVLVELSKQSLEAYTRWASDSQRNFGFEQKGLLIVANTTSGLEAALEELRLVSAHGVAGKPVDEHEIRQLEPAITGRGITGGVFFPDEAHVSPLATVEMVRDRCLALGVTILPRTELVSLDGDGRRIAAAATSRGTLTADSYVLATGAWSHDLARKVRVKVPVLSGKGYSLTIAPPDPAPRIPIMLIDKKVAVTPLPQHTKLAGTLELVGVDETITQRRVAAIVRGARQFLTIPERPPVVELWRGLRPCTPDGVPIVGRPSRFDNLLLATGHQMLGLQTAPATGRLLADVMLNTTPLVDPAPFAPQRFE
ncbi:MAG TPA: FAD-dependent oxidoreductase [Pirellulales bacterium]|nr:FAD-dependent oxidoreductase [Pirellulales bacterium]